MSKNKKSFVKSLKKNPWIVSTGVLALLVIILLFVGGVSSGKAVDEKKAGEGLVSYLASVGYTGFEVESVESEGSMYLIQTSYNGQEVPFYVTKEGYLVGNSLVSVVSETEEKSPSSGNSQVEVSKADVPEAGLYIWSYCPYGVTALSPYAEVAKLLGEEANFKVYLYYAGHGEYEEQQNKIQACIQDLDYTEEYWDYAKTFVDEIYSSCNGDIDCDLEKSTSLMDSLGIDSGEVLTCVEEKGDDLLEEHYQSAQQLGVTGSPTLVVNGAKVSVSRNAEAFKGAVCSGFNDAPETCGETLDSTGSVASGNC